jgi:hypothetical protein
MCSTLVECRVCIGVGHWIFWKISIHINQYPSFVLFVSWVCVISLNWSTSVSFCTWIFVSRCLPCNTTTLLCKSDIYFLHRSRINRAFGVNLYNRSLPHIIVLLLQTCRQMGHQWVVPLAAEHWWHHVSDACRDWMGVSTVRARLFYQHDAKWMARIRTKSHLRKKENPARGSQRRIFCVLGYADCCRG